MPPISGHPHLPQEAVAESRKRLSSIGTFALESLRGNRSHYRHLPITSFTMDMKKGALVFLVAAVCMTVVATASKPQPIDVDVPPKVGDIAPAPITATAPTMATASGEATSSSPSTASEIASSANAIGGCLAGASFLSFLALYL